MRTWDAQAWLRAVEQIGELKDVGIVEEAELSSLSISAGEFPASCFVAKIGSRTIIFNRFGTPRRVALALGLGSGIERSDVLDFWRSEVARGGLSTAPDPPPAEDRQYAAIDAAGREGWDKACWQAYPRSAILERELERAGVPNVTSVWFPPEGEARALVVLAVKQSHAGHVAQALTVAAQAGGLKAAEDRRFVIVVDEDIDIFNMNDVLWALLTRCDPVRDMNTIRGVAAGSQLLIDATKPWEWKERFAETITDASAERTGFERWGWILDPEAPDPRSHVS